MVHVSSHVTSPYLNTVVGKDTSLLTSNVLRVWLETGQIYNVVHQRQKREEKKGVDIRVQWRDNKEIKMQRKETTRS